MKLMLGELESLLNKKFTAGYQSVVDETNTRRAREFIEQEVYSGLSKCG